MDCLGNYLNQSLASMAGREIRLHEFNDCYEFYGLGGSDGTPEEN
jgi:hypothetical protein